MTTRITPVLIMGLVVTLAGCATTVRTTPPPSDPTFADPFEPFNRAMYDINDGIDQVIIGPAAALYQAVIPKVGRNGVRNVIDNLRTPLWAANEVLQGDFADAQNTIGRFAVNSTLGFGGIFDPATDMGLVRQQEDFGQTLATYGVGSGPYIVLPLLGPTSPRDLVGNLGETVISPMQALDLGTGSSLGQGTIIVGGLDRRARVGSTLERINSSADPYAALRSLYAQSRAIAIHEDADPYADLPDF